MGFLEEERKRLGLDKKANPSSTALSFLDQERANLGLTLSPAGIAQQQKRNQRDDRVETQIPNIGDPAAAIRNLPSQIQQNIAGPEPGPNASQAERDAWATKKVREDAARAQAQKNAPAAVPAPQKNGFFDTIGNLFNPKSYSNENIAKNLNGDLAPVRDAMAFGNNVIDSATLGAAPFLADQARKIPGSQYLMTPKSATDAVDAAAQRQKGTWVGTTAELAGALVPYAGAYRLTGGLAKSLNAGRGPIASNFVRGTLAGGAYGAANEVAEAGFGKNNQSIPERIQDTAISAALGGVGDAAVSAVLPFLGRAAQKYLPGFRSTPDAPAAQPALPLGQRDVRLNAAAQRGVNAPGTDPIATPFAFGLPRTTAEGAAAAANRFGGESQLLASRTGARVVQEYQALRSAADVERAAGRPAPSNAQLYAQARQSVEAAPNITRTNTPLVEGRPTGTVVNDRVTPDTPAAPTPQRTVPEPAPPNDDFLYEQAIRNNDVEAMMQIDPPTALRMRANNGSLERETTRAQNQAPAAAPVSEATPSASRLPDRLTPAASSVPENPLLARPLAPRATENPLAQPLRTPEPAPAPNAEITLGPDVDNGLGIVAGTGRRDPYFVPTNDTRSQIVSRANRDVRSLTDTGTYRAAADRIYQNFIDDLSPIQRKIDKTIERVLDRKLDAGESPYKMALASRGADMTARQIITNGMVDARGEVIGKSLKEVLAPIRTQRENVKFEDYLLNKHAITRAGRGEKVFRDQLNWTPQTAANKIAAYDREFPQFQEAANDLYQFQKQLVDNWLVDSGMISRQQADAWLTENPFYVPNKRYFSDLEKTGNAFGSGGRGVASTSNPVKGYSKTGSQRKIISPVEAIIENVDAYVKVAQRNKTMQQVYKFVTTYPDDFADFATIIRKQDENLPTNDLEALVADLGRDFDKGTQVFKMDTDNIVRVQVNGNTLRMKINDKPFLEALTAMGPQGSGWLLETVGSVTNFFKKYTTGSNPFFAFTRNLPRDFVQGYVSSKTTSNPFKYFGDYVQSIGDIMFNREAYQAYKNIGGGHSSSVSADRNLLAQSKRQLVGKKGPLNQLSRVNDAYDNVMNAVESAPRLGEFKRAMANGGSAKQGLFEASDVTVNFKRKGRLARDIDKVFPYFNAAMQGLDQLGRLYANPATRGKAIAKGIVSLSIPTAVLYTMNRNDPAYQQLTDREKDNYFHIPKGDGTFWKIAKPRELGTIFSDVIERGMRTLDGEGNEAFRGFMEQLRVAFLPPGISGLTKDTDISDRLLGDTIAAPFTQLGANKNFAGSPIVPGYLERLSPELQKDAKTSKLGETLAGLPVVGKIADNSPKKADFLIRAYTGWIGQFGTAATSPGVGLGKALEQQVSVDPVYSNDISNELYDYKTKLDQAYADREYRELPEWYNDNIRKYLNDVSGRMSDIRSMMRDIQDDTTIGNDEKTKQLREMQTWINELAEEGNSSVRGTIPR